MRITICGETPTSPEVVLVVPGEWEDEARDVWKTARGPVFTLPHDKAGMPELVLGDSDEEWDAAEQAEESQSALQPQPAPQPRPAPEHPAKSGFFGGGRPDVVDVVDVVDRAGETGDAELEEVD